MNEATRDLKAHVVLAASGTPLTAAQADEAFDIIMSGQATPSQLGGFLMALAMRGETVEEIAGGARAMRAKMHAMSAPQGAIDIVGTGGDGKGTLNISTATAIVVAGCGVTVAKHGNRKASSQSGTADVFSLLGVDLEADYDVVQRAIDEAGIGFMIAPRYADHVQSAGALVEPCQRQALSSGCVCRTMGRAGSARAGRTGRRTRLGRPQRRRLRRTHVIGRKQGCRAGKWQSHRQHRAGR
jgi:hypothetical protein